LGLGVQEGREERRLSLATLPSMTSLATPLRRLLGFGVWGVGFRVWGWGLGFGVWGVGFGILGFGAWGLGVWGLVFGV